MKLFIKFISIQLILFFIVGCLPISNNPISGPDKQDAGMFLGAALGAGSGAITGAQLSAAAGPGALVGAGLGAAFGLFSGLGVDLLEEEELKALDEITYLSGRAWAQETLAEYYKRRSTLHPNREIFPANFFFGGDSVVLDVHSDLLLSEYARLSKNRKPWSRILIASYITTSDPDSMYSNYLAGKRAENIANSLVRCGIEPRRVVTKVVPVVEPVIELPNDPASSFSQAIEFVFLD